MSTNPKTTARAIDEPLGEPARDLLDMDRHARALAEYIKQDRKVPFTVGIFGEWGEGKTTLVNFVKRHLTPTLSPDEQGPPPPFYFVNFSAWAYTTSEKLWRALILEIARVVYIVPEHTESQDDDQQNLESNKVQPDLFTRLSAFLQGDLFRKKGTPRVVTPFEKLKIDLDRADYGNISKRTPAESLDEEAVMAAVVNGALSVFGTVSPLVAGIRSFIGEPKLDSGKSVPAAGDQPPSEDSDSLSKFKRLFKKIIESRAGKEPVYVFIDDLDRVQPEVAFDIMESIRIALYGTDCVYILAVDERLIAQGLRLRYRELFKKVDGLDIALKGHEYLEKIIQFRMPVPPRTPEQTQRLIAAEFPHWTPAGDIIQSIVGNNPRRVKQYCQRLSFQNMIGSPFTLGSTPEIEAPPTARAAEPREPDISEALALSRFIRPPNFNELEIPDLFLLLNEPYGQYDGTPFERASAMIKRFDDGGRLNDLKRAVETLKPGLLALSNIRPAE